MRVVSGALRGRRLVAPPAERGVSPTRPTTDKVRESLFNALGSRDLIDGARVADLFAGSGAMGIEAISRGARSCVFVERDHRALQALLTNVRQLELADRVEVLSVDVMRLGGRMPSVDIVFADPPYEFDRWAELLSNIDAELVIAESDRPLPEVSGRVVSMTRRYGRTWVTWFEKVP